MASLYNTSISNLKGVGTKKLELFSKLGIQSVGALLHYYPRGYEKWSIISGVSEAPFGEVSTIRGTVVSRVTETRVRGGMIIYKAVVSDGISDLTLTFFNNRFIGNIIKEGETYLFRGKISGSFFKKEMTSPEIMKDSDKLPIRPVYSQTAGLNSRAISGFVKAALELLPNEINETIPLYIRDDMKLCDLQYALYNIHFPESEEALEKAKKRLVFEELLVLQIGILMLGGQRRERCRYIIRPFDKKFFSFLPFLPTSAQRRAITEMLYDMKSGFAMSRLLQGDVGSGKTVVAAALCYSAVMSGFQCAVMAPTEILAIQHFETFTKLLSAAGIKVELLTGAVKGAKRKKILENLKMGAINIIIGTHALLTEDVEFNKLSLVITDEQHRFGVNQRIKLNQKGDHPHTCVMSATPIPRTLALMIYGDLDISVLDELPPGRQKIDTYAVSSDKRKRIYSFLLKQIKEGRQCYIICPLVEEGESEMASVLEYSEMLRKDPIFSGCKIGTLYGKMKNKEKNEVMNDFAAGKTDILVSTTVVEVGVDVPNATTMLIENAERYGLSQLHQLRGRVGRGKYKSYCILISDAQNEEAVQRLKTMSSTNDGFKIADEDLRMRGPGNFFGNEQHGLPKLQIADLHADMTVLKSAQEYSQMIITKDPGLDLDENRALRAQVRLLFHKTENSI